jgi:hypothetical protein
MIDYSLQPRFGGRPIPHAFAEVSTDIRGEILVTALIND